MKTSIKIFFVTALLSLLLACGNNNIAQTTPTNSPSSKDSAGVSIQVTAKEMEFKLSQSTVPPGTVEFVATNNGTIPHEMEVIKTDLPVDKLPITSDGRLDTDKAGKEIGEIDEDELKSGTTKTLKLNLTPGNYMIVCNLPGHFQAGMRTLLTVK